MGFFFNGIFYCNHSEQDVNRRSHWAYDEDITLIRQPSSVIVMATRSHEHSSLHSCKHYIGWGGYCPNLQTAVLYRRFRQVNVTIGKINLL